MSLVLLALLALGGAVLGLVVVTRNNPPRHFVTCVIVDAIAVGLMVPLAVPIFALLCAFAIVWSLPHLICFLCRVPWSLQTVYRRYADRRREVRYAREQLRIQAWEQEVSASMRHGYRSAPPAFVPCIDQDELGPLR